MRALLLLVLASCANGQSGVRIAAWDTCGDAHECWTAIFDTPRPEPIEEARVVPPAAFAPSQVTPPTPLPPPLTGTSVSFSPQGDAAMRAMVGHTIPNIGMDEVTICAPPGTTVSGGSVYQLANSVGISTLSPALTRRVFTRTAALSKQQTIFTAVQYGLLAVPIMGEAGVITLSSKSLFSLLAGHGIFDMLSAKYAPLLPDPSPFLDDLLDPQASFILSGDCKVATIGVEYSGKVAARAPVRGRFALTR